MIEQLATAKVVFAFSGQGSQFPGMGLAFFESHRVYRDWMLRLDAVARRHAGVSVVEHLYSRPHPASDPFEEIRLTHPGIFMVEYALTQVLLAAGIQPDAVIGASLGEYCAAAVAGVLDWREALELVLDQAQVLNQYCTPGGMLAVLGSESLYYESARLQACAEIAAFNFEGNFVLSGSAEAIGSAQLELADMGVLVHRLPVRHAFHSSLMDAARAELLARARTLTVSRARLPVISCTTGGLLAAPAADHFWELVRRPIRVSQAVEFLDRYGAHDYLDVGPGGTFANLIKYNRRKHPGSRTHALLTPLGRPLDALNAAVTTLSGESALRIAD